MFFQIMQAAQAKSNAKRWSDATALWEQVVKMNPVDPDYWRQSRGTSRPSFETCATKPRRNWNSISDADRAAWLAEHSIPRWRGDNT